MARLRLCCQFLGTLPSKPTSFSFLQFKAYNRRKERGKPISPSTTIPQGGIPNLGNTCYANAGSQILVPLMPAILPKDKLKDTQAEALRSGFQDLFSHITNIRETKESMTSLFTAYSKCANSQNSEEGMYRQHDAQAFLQLGLDKMSVVAVACHHYPAHHPYRWPHEKWQQKLP